jgi:hypothetical protein
MIYRRVELVMILSRSDPNRPGGKEDRMDRRDLDRLTGRALELLKENKTLKGRISQLEADAQLSERAMRAALALLDTSLETGDGYALPLIELVRVRGLLKSALRIG